MIIDDNGGQVFSGSTRGSSTGRRTQVGSPCSDRLNRVRNHGGSGDPDAELTQRTRADVIREANATPTPTTDSEFGLAELKSAFADLPDSFQELDPAGAGVSREGLGFEGRFITDLAGRIGTLPANRGREWSVN